jgi:DNA-binding beta-propeller fold protein YncE
MVVAPRARFFATFVLCTSIGCTKTDHETVYDTYDANESGAPYPNTRPALLSPPGHLALVPNSGADTISVVDLDTSKLRGDAPVGRDPLIIDGPHQIVVDNANAAAWVVLSYPASSATAGQHTHGTSTRAGWVQKLALDDLRPLGEIIVSDNPGEIAVSDDGSRVVVSHFDLKAATTGDTIETKRATLALIDPKTVLPFGTPQSDELLVCVAPHGIDLSRPDGATAFVACYGEDAIGIVNLKDTHAPVVLVPVAQSVGMPGMPILGPYGVALSPDGTRLAIADKESKDVRMLDVATQKMETFVAPVNGSPLFPSWSKDGASVYVPVQAPDALVVLDAKTGAMKAAHAFDAATCAGPLDASLSAASGSITLVCEGNASTPGALVLLDPATLDVKSRVQLSGFSGRPAFVGAAK